MFESATGRIDSIIGKFQVMVDGLDKSIGELHDAKVKNTQEIARLNTQNELHDQSINRAASVRDKLVKIIE